jgi:hypothetical protein
LVIVMIEVFFVLMFWAFLLLGLGLIKLWDWPERRRRRKQFYERAQTRHSRGDIW